jgi:hypothetical protein
MRVLLFTCSDSVVVDQRRNSVSIFNLLEELNAATFPFVIPMATVFVYLERAEDESPGDMSIKMTIDRQELFRIPLQLDFQGRLRLRLMNEVRGLVIPAPGLFRLTVEREGVVLASWEMPINNIGQPVAEPVQPVQ